jgi:glycosyltransferase involved in cell wall biosynthesis
MAELVVDGERGCLVEAGNVDQLAGAMLKLCQEPDLARKMGARALEYAKANHSEDGHYRHLMDIYASVLALQG